jgi:hypothetical protein
VGGEVWIDHGYGKVIVEDAAADATVRGDHTEVAGQRIKGRVDVGTSYENVRVDDIRGDLTVEGKSVEVTGRSIAAREVRITTPYENLDLADYTGSAIISLSHGDAVLAPSSLDFPLAWISTDNNLVKVGPNETGPSSSIATINYPTKVPLQVDPKAPKPG